MSGERYYTTKIWPQPSSTGSSNEDASFISTDPRGEPVTSTWKKSCREVETVPEFPELTCQNFRNPHLLQPAVPDGISREPIPYFLRCTRPLRSCARVRNI